MSGILPALRITDLASADTLSGAEALAVVRGTGAQAVTLRSTVSQLAGGHTHPSTALTHLPGGTGAVALSLAQLLNELPVSVRSYGAACDGVTDDSAAFQRAVDAIPSGQQRRILVPATAMLNTVVNNNSRSPIWEFAPGADIVGGAATKFQWPTRRIDQSATARHEYTVALPDAGAGTARHRYTEIRAPRSLGATPGYGVRLDYISGFYGAGFDIAQGVVASWSRQTGDDGGQALAEWLVAISPTLGGASTRWGLFVAEWNPVNRHADHGWSPTRVGMNNFTGAFQVVPEAKVFGQGGLSYDVLFGIVLSRSSELKATDGYSARMHNAILLEPDSLTSSGRFAYVTGRTVAVDGSQTPEAIIEGAGEWKGGLRLHGATFSGQVVTLPEAGALAWLSPGVGGAGSERGRISIGADGAMLLGWQGSTRGVARKRVWAAGRQAADGDRQCGAQLLRRTTTDGTALRLTADALASVAANNCTLPPTSLFRVSILMGARQSGGSAGTVGDAATWRIEAAIKQGAGAAATAFVGTPTVTKEFQDAAAAAWTAAVTADTALGCLAITVTGETNKTIQWLADITSVELVG
jgi:hypothetical protein